MKNTIEVNSITIVEGCVDLIMFKTSLIRNNDLPPFESEVILELRLKKGTGYQYCKDNFDVPIRRIS